MSPSLGDLPNPGIEPRSPTLQMDSLLTEPPGKPFFLAVYMGCFILLRMIHAKVGWVWADVPLCTERNKVSL